MKKRNKKGFTIVELVIVIAVIAVLAAVLIPTFSNIIEKANESADIQAARQMNMALAAGSIPDAPTEFEEVVEILADAGFNSRDCLIPVTKNCKFFWYKPANVIVLAKLPESAAGAVALLSEDEEAPEILFPTDDEDLVAELIAILQDIIENGTESELLFDLRNGYPENPDGSGGSSGSGGSDEPGSFNGTVATADDLAAALSQGGDIKLTQSVTLNSSTFIDTDTWDDYYSNYSGYYGGLVNIPEGSTTTLDLGGNTLTIDVGAFTQMVGDEEMEAEQFIYNCGTFTLKNGTLLITGAGAAGACALYNEEGGIMTIVEDATITSTVTDEAAASLGTALLLNSGTLTMRNTEVNAQRGCLYVGSDAVSTTISNCTFNTEHGEFNASHNVAYAVYIYSEGNLALNGAVNISFKDITYFEDTKGMHVVDMSNGWNEGDLYGAHNVVGVFIDTDWQQNPINPTVTVNDVEISETLTDFNATNDGGLSFNWQAYTANTDAITVTVQGSNITPIDIYHKNS